jgi:hypothetical protein
MQISMSGVLTRAASAIEHDEEWAYLSGALLQLLEHLQELKRRREEPGILDEFFNVWAD